MSANVSALGIAKGASEIKNRPLKEFIRTISIGARYRMARIDRNTNVTLS
jgi:hypothetical protein